MSYTLAQQLEAVQTAIMSILNGAQRVSVNGRDYEKAELKTLIDMQNMLMKQISAGGGGTGGGNVLRTLAQL